MTTQASQLVLDHLAEVPDRAVDVHRVLEQDGLVVTHSTRQGPEGRREVAFDLWRVEDDRVQHVAGEAEPWVDQTANGHSQVDGVTGIDHTADRAQTAAVVRATVQTLLVANDFSAVDRYLAGEAYVQHNHRFADGISGLSAALAALAEQGISMTYTQVHELVAEGNFGYTYSDGVFGSVPYVFHDLFRVADGRAVEHWDVMTAVTTPPN